VRKRDAVRELKNATVNTAMREKYDYADRQEEVENSVEVDNGPDFVVADETVATEPDRIRTAVVKALRDYGDANSVEIALEIENGADW
jgi:osmotically-inducible protein OsmY